MNQGDRRRPLSRRLWTRRIAVASATLWTGALGAVPAVAQDNSTLLQPAVPVDYDRGRNVSVLQRPRPDYDPLGIRRGSVMIYPRIDLGLGASDNVFLSSANKQGDGFVSFAPSVRAETDWSRHEVRLSAGGRFRRYFDNGLRNVDEWNVGGLGRLDLGTDFSLTAEGQAARTQEDPFNGATDANVAALSRYRRNLAGLRGEYRHGHVRTVLSYDYQDFNFAPINLGNGTTFSQANRDRSLSRVAGQFEYAFSPSLAAYTQVSYLRTDYSTQISPGVPNRDSDGYRAIAGFSLDVSGFYRGIIGIGYTRRDFISPLYKDVGGLSAEAQAEYFPSDFTTFTLNLRRTIEDSNIGILSAYFDNRASLKVDHELRRNLIVSAGGEYAKQDYIGTSTIDDIWRARVGARYLASRLVSLQGELSHGNRRRSGVSNGFTINETAGIVSLILQR